MGRKIRLMFYDFEVFKEDWLVCMTDYLTKQECVIVNDRDKLIKLYNKFKDDTLFIGFNNRHYDDVIFKGILINMNPKEVNDKLIEGKKAHEICKTFNKIKLYSYDTLLLNKSLKQLELFMGSDIKETDVPFDIDRKLTTKEIEETIKYCKHDVSETIKVFEATINDFKAHKSLIERFRLPLNSFSKTKAKLSAEILEAERQHGLNDGLDYEFLPTIKLNKYKYIQDWFDTHREYTYVNEKGTNKKMQLETEVFGINTIYGFGGLHSARKKYFHKVEENELIVHSDVASFYPSIMRNYKLLSRAVHEPEKFNEIMDERLRLKGLGDKKGQAPLKIVINATYGICKDKWSKMFDEKRANEICINCQLFLTDLLEKLEQSNLDLELIQANTDGIIVLLKNKSEFEQYKEICNEWEKRTRFKLEHDLIKNIMQKDVNNYVFEFENGKLERKGAYVKEYSPIDNNLSIVTDAVVEYLLHETPVEETINNCDELIKFQMCCKIGSTYNYMMWGDKILNTKCNRVFATTKDLPGLSKVKCNFKNKKGEVADKIEKVASTPEKVMIYNEEVIDKSVLEVLPELDKQFYIDLAKKRLKDFGIKFINS
jgi:hypothetical protein